MKIIKVGRHPDNDIVFPAQNISGNHAEIEFQDNGSIIYHDHSTNGTLINGSVVLNKSVVINDSDEVFLPGKIKIDICEIRARYVGRKTVEHNSPLLEPINSQSEEKPHAPHSPVNPILSMEPVASSRSSSQSKTAENKSQITFGNVIAHLFKHYADFDGRARRREFWLAYVWYFLYLIICYAVLYIFQSDVLFYVLCIISGLIFFVPFLALFVRRLHDINLSGGHIFWMLIPIVNLVLLLVWTLKDSYPETNKWGECSKHVI